MVPELRLLKVEASSGLMSASLEATAWAAARRGAGGAHEALLLLLLPPPLPLPCCGLALLCMFGASPSAVWIWAHGQSLKLRTAHTVEFLSCFPCTCPAPPSGQPAHPHVGAAISHCPSHATLCGCCPLSLPCSCSPCAGAAPSHCPGHAHAVRVLPSLTALCVRLETTSQAATSQLRLLVDNSGPCHPQHSPGCHGGAGCARGAEQPWQHGCARGTGTSSRNC